jgi:hypothetical protein
MITRQSGGLARYRPTGKLLRILRRHRTQMSQVAFVSHKHNNNVRVGMVAEFLQPPCHVIVSLVFADVVDEQGAYSTTVVCRRDGPVPLLTCSIPNLGLDCLRVDLDRPGSEFDTNG